MEKNKKFTEKQKMVLKIALGIMGLVLLIAWSGGFFKQKLSPGEVKVETGFPVPDGVETYEVKSQPVAPRIDVVGTAVSEEKILLSSRISAYVKRVFVSAGDRVKEGQILVTLDNRELKEQLAAAEAQLTQATTEYNRTKKLIKAGAATDQALTAAKTAFEAAQAGVKQIEVMLTFTEIKSPIDGKVTDRRIEAGDLANPGQVLLGVFAPYNMRIEVPVPVRLVGKLQLDQEVDVELDRPSRPFKGKVTEVVGEVDPMSRTQRVKVHLEGMNADVLPGTFGRVWVHDDPRPSYLIPFSAVYRIGQLEMVQIIKGKRVLRRLIKTGQAYGDKLEVLSGLSDGSVILVEPIKG